MKFGDLMGEALEAPPDRYDGRWFWRHCIYPWNDKILYGSFNLYVMLHALLGHFLQRYHFCDTRKTHLTSGIFYYLLESCLWWLCNLKTEIFGLHRSVSFIYHSLSLALTESLFGTEPQLLKWCGRRTFNTCRIDLNALYGHSRCSVIKNQNTGAGTD